MTISEVIAALYAIQYEHGDVEVSTGGPEGDTVDAVWFDAVAYVG